MKPPGRYSALQLALTGAACTFPALSTAPAQVAVKRPTPFEPVVVTVSDAGRATTESSVVAQPGAGTAPRTYRPPARTPVTETVGGVVSSRLKHPSVYLSELLPSGHVVLDQIAPVKLAPNALAPVRFAPVRLVPSSVEKVRATLARSAPFRVARLKLALDAAAPVRFAPAMLAPARTALLASAWSRSACARPAFFMLAPVRSA